MSIMRIEKANHKVLRECREQLALSVDKVKKTVAPIEAIEAGDKKPTIRQLSDLADIYGVPRWVFIAETLPIEYQFNRTPAFRKFSEKQSSAFSDRSVRLLTAKVGQLREMVVELRDDMDEPIPHFSPPDIENSSAEIAAQRTRNWLGVNKNLKFLDWKKVLEEKNIFVFMTDKYRGWSHIDKNVLRGFSIYESILPIIVINDSDAMKAQSFTLFHELGHLLRREHEIDDFKRSNSHSEKWCDEFAGNVLMPTDAFQKLVGSVGAIDKVKSVAEQFQVSPYACLVRMRQLSIVTQNQYEEFENILKREYQVLQEKLKNSPGGPSRNRPTEVLNQYGAIYTRTLVQAYRNKEIGLHKLCKLFGLKQASDALKLEAEL